MRIEIINACNGFKLTEERAAQIRSTFCDMGQWAHTFKFGDRISYWEFFFFHTSIN